MKNNKTEPIPVMDYRQYRRARRLVHECCNYIDGNCIALDDGEECVCVQSISYSLQSGPAKSCRLCGERRSSETSGLCCLRQSERGAACGNEVSGGGIAAGYKFLNLVEEIVFV